MSPLAHESSQGLTWRYLALARWPRAGGSSHHFGRWRLPQGCGGRAWPPSRAGVDPSRLRTEQIKTCYFSPGSALGCLHDEGCQSGPGAMVVGLYPMMALQDGGGSCLRGKELSFPPHLQKARLGHLNPVVASPNVPSGAPKQALPQNLHCLGHPFPLLPHASISPCITPAHPTHNSIPNVGRPV